MRPSHPLPPERERVACTYRFGEGCFARLGYPEQLAALRDDERITIEIPPEVAHSGGVAALLRHVKNASAAWAGWAQGRRPRGVLVDVTRLARATSEDALLQMVGDFIAR